ncbi:VOC family protein [Ruminiclostridium sufflavum]|nr:VOC family protein [Ruminiclostridium sufflavum]
MSIIDNINGVQHLGVPVRDIERSKKWYIDTLGFQLMYQMKINDSNGEVNVAFIKLKDFILELYQLSGEEYEEIKGRGHGHIDHIAFDVDDIDEIYKEIKKSGIDTIEGTPKFLPFWKNGVKFLTILGPDKEKIEFNQKL